MIDFAMAIPATPTPQPTANRAFASALTPALFVSPGAIPPMTNLPIANQSTGLPATTNAFATQAAISQALPSSVAEDQSPTSIPKARMALRFLNRETIIDTVIATIKDEPPLFSALSADPGKYGRLTALGARLGLAAAVLGPTGGGCPTTINFGGIIQYGLNGDPLPDCETESPSVAEDRCVLPTAGRYTLLVAARRRDSVGSYKGIITAKLR